MPSSSGSPEAPMLELSELSSAFELASASANEDGLPNSLLIYKAATLIYEMTNGNGNGTALSPTAIVMLNRSFYSLLASVDDAYLSDTILKDLNEGLVTLTSHANETLQEMTTTGMGMGNRDKQPEQKLRLEQDLSKCFAAMKAFHAIYAITGKQHEEDGDNESENDKQRRRCCRLGFHDQVCSQIVFLYDAACQCDAPMQLKECILGILHSWVLHGLILNQNSSTTSIDTRTSSANEDDVIQFIMNAIQNISSEKHSTCLGDLLVWQQQQQNSNTTGSIEEAIHSSFGNQVHAQKEYLLLMLSSAKTSVEKPHKKNANIVPNPKRQQQEKPSKRNRKEPQKSGVDVLIEQIKQLFPHYGDGYIEAALACYDHDLEKTTSALVEVEMNPHTNSNLVHPRLRALDKKLPSRRKQSKSQYTYDNETLDQDDLEAREVQKAHMREMAVQEENEAYLLSAALGGEYNDDYDDQYDGIGDDGGAAGGIGAADSGLYDVPSVPDFNAIKAYNKVAKEMESDRLFWEENRNTNRSSGGRSKGRNGNRNANGNKKQGGDTTDADGKEDNGSDTSNVKKYRGPDKGKGGRLIGPDGKYLPFPKSRKKGGGGMKQQGGGEGTGDGPAGGGGEANKDNAKKGKDASAQMSKIQKRRKNDNKAKIANHHRKERAMKKGAM